MRINFETFKTLDDVETVCIAPSESRRQKGNWYIWIKPDGSGLLVINSQKKRIKLPANSNRSDRETEILKSWVSYPEHIVSDIPKKNCTDSVCPLLGATPHQFGPGCRLWQ